MEMKESRSYLRNENREQLLTTLFPSIANTVDISISQDHFSGCHSIGWSDGPLFPEKKHRASRIERQPRASLPIAILSHSRSFALLHHFALITSRLYLRRALYFKLPLTKLYSSVTNDESHVLARLLLAFAFTRYPLPKVSHVPVDAPVLFTISMLR